MSPTATTTSTKVLQIRASSSCSRGCSFCATPSNPAVRDLTLCEIRDNIDFFMERRGINELVFSGGEVTDRGDFADLLAMLRERRGSLKLVTVITSGQGWSEATVRGSVGVLDRVVVSLTPRNERDLREASSFTGQALDTVRRLLDAGLTVQTNTVILPENLSLLGCVAELVTRLEVSAPTFTFPFPHGKLREDLERSVAPWSRVTSSLFEAVQIARSRGPRIKNLPLCYLGAYERLCSRTSQRILIQRGRQLEDHAIIPPFIGLGFFPQCQGCPLRARCDGFWEEYLALDGFPELGYDHPARSTSAGSSLSDQPAERTQVTPLDTIIKGPDFGPPRS